MSVTQAIKTNISLGFLTIIFISGCTFVEDRSLDEVIVVDANENKKSIPKTQITLNKPSSKILDYYVQAGDTLGIIAMKTLGNRDQYHLIANYNSLTINSPLKIGQKLLIPNGQLTTNNDFSVKPLIRATTTSNIGKSISDKEIDQLISTGKYNQAIDWAISKPNLSKNYDLQAKLIEATTKQVTIEKSQNDYSEAHFLVSGLLSNHSFTTDNELQLVELKKSILVEQYSFEGENQLEKEKFDLSYKSLLSAYSTSSQLANSNAIFTKSRSLVTEHMHQEALKLYRNQQLKQALTIWNKILAIKPNDDLALVYKDRVSSLQKKLSDI